MIRIWDVESGREVRALQGHSAAVNSIAFSPGGDRILSGSADGTVRVWQVDGSVAPRTLAQLRGAVQAVALSSDGQQVAAAGESAEVTILDAQSAVVLKQLVGSHSDPPSCLAFAPDGPRLYVGSRTGVIDSYDIRSGRAAKALLAHLGAILALTVHPNGQLLASASDDTTIKLWKP